MIKDPILEEIWKFREVYAARFNYDLDAIFQDLKQKEKKKKRKLVSFASKASLISEAEMA